MNNLLFVLLTEDKGLSIENITAAGALFLIAMSIIKLLTFVLKQRFEKVECNALVEGTCKVFPHLEEVKKMNNVFLLDVGKNIAEINNSISDINRAITEANKNISRSNDQICKLMEHKDEKK